jgi:hypothetical protein
MPLPSNFHEAVSAFDKDSNWIEVDTPDSETTAQWEKIANYIDRKLWEPAQNYRQRFDQNWERYYNFYKNKQWPQFRRSWQACLTINMTKATIEAIVATMTDNKPKINLLPSDQSQEIYVDTLNALIDTIWRRREVLFYVQEALRHALIFGVGFMKVFWDPELESGAGDVAVSVPSPWSIWIEPYAKSFKDSSFVIQGDWVSIDYIRRVYPENAKYVRPGMGAPQKRGRRKTSAISFADEPTVVSPVAGQSQFVADAFSPPGKQDNFLDKDFESQQVFLTECWFLDDEEKDVIEDLPAEHPVTGEVFEVKQVITQRKYPYGRVVTKVGKIILRDIAAPYKSEEWPFVLFKDNSDPDEFFYGMGEVEDLEDIQKELNKRRSQLADHFNLMGNAIWIVDDTCQVEPDKLTNRPGSIVTKRAGGECRREAPPPPPPMLIQSIDMVMRDFQNIPGVSDVLGGMVPRGIRSGAGLSEAQDISATRVRLKVKQLERSITSIGRLVIKLVQQYYTKPRVIQILGANNQVQWVEFDGTAIRGDWDIVMGSGSTLPVSKVIRFEQAVRLYQLKAIDRRALLDAADWPNREEILRRLGDDAGAQADQVPAADIQAPPPKTDNSRSRRTGRSQLADAQQASSATPGPSKNFGSAPSEP